MNPNPLPNPSPSRNSGRTAILAALLLSPLVLGLAGMALAGGRRGAPPVEVEASPDAAPETAEHPFFSVFGAGQTDRKFDSLETMHADHLQRFQTTPGFGMSRVLRMPQSSLLTLCDETFRVPKPALIALTSATVAYHNRGLLVGMADLTNGFSRTRLLTRPLSRAEQRAVAELRTGKELVLQPASFPLLTPGGTNLVAGTLAVGALRAGAACARCHDCEEGTLLGAFSYALIPENRLPTGQTSLELRQLRQLRQLEQLATPPSPGVALVR